MAKGRCHHVSDISAARRSASTATTGGRACSLSTTLPSFAPRIERPGAGTAEARVVQFQVPADGARARVVIAIEVMVRDHFFREFHVDPATAAFRQLHEAWAARAEARTEDAGETPASRDAFNRYPRPRALAQSPQGLLSFTAAARRVSVSIG